MGKISGLSPKIHLYTVPGQSYYEASRKLVLRGADGVVFVADSNRNRVNENLESWENMKAHLISLNIPSDLPLIVQLNKRDLPNAMSVPELRQNLGLNGNPVFESIAVQGKGVFNTLKAIINGVVMRVQREMA